MADEATATAALLSAGRHVKIHGLASEKARQHNGKTAVIKKPLDEATGRCCIQTVGGSSKKILAIKPSNLTILCSLCKMREEKTEPERILCLRCKKTSYCSEVCKEKHWRGANPQSDMPNCHKAWCIPIDLEMEPPTHAVGDSNVGEEEFECTQKYLEVAADVGNDGRRNEERVMLERLLEVDRHQPMAYLNLFNSYHDLATMAERYAPEKCHEYELKAIVNLTVGIDLLVSNAVPGGSLEGQTDRAVKHLIMLINVRAIRFLDGCLRGQRGADNPVLQSIEQCLTSALALYNQRGESPHLVHHTLAYCCMKLQKYAEAAQQFELCRDTSRNLSDKHFYHVSLMQMPLCLVSVAMYGEDKDASLRADAMERAVSKFKEAIEVLKVENPSMVYQCQAKFARSLFNQNSLMNQLAMQGGIEYSQEDKNEVRATMSTMASAALQGATAAGDSSEIQAMQSLISMPFQ